MPNADNVHARLEVSFILSDPRYRGLKASGKALYIGLWCLSVQERKEVLPARYDAPSLGSTCGIDTRTVKSGLDALRKAGLIAIDPTGCINVLGAADKHKRMTRFEPEKKAPRKPREPKAIIPKGYTEEFEQFWAAYPASETGRSTKAGSFVQWNRRLAEGCTAKAMIAGAKRYAKLDKPKEYVKGAQVFIGQDRWFEGGDEGDKKVPKPSAFERFCGPHCREANKIKLFKWLDKNPGLTLDAVLAMAIKGEVYISPADEGKLKEWLNG